MRAFGMVLLVLLAVPLLVSVRMTPAAPPDVAGFLEVMGGLASLAGVRLIVAPEMLGRLAETRLLTMADGTLRVFGAINIAFGLFLGWIAFVVL